MALQLSRPDFFTFDNGEQAQLPFSADEYSARLAGLRRIMLSKNLDAVLLTSMHCVAYYSGFLYCAFGRPYGCVITQKRCVTISANIDGGQPARRCIEENLIYTDWRRDNYWRSVKHVLGATKRLGIEADHLTCLAQQQLSDYLASPELVDIAPLSMQQRLVKSEAELKLIESAAAIADIGGEAVRNAIKVGVREIDVAMAGRDAMELAIAEHYPSSELRDSWVWFQSGLNTDGAHNPVTTRQVQLGDVLSMNTFPMVSGYYVALERTLFMGEPDPTSRRIWEANVAAHELGISLIKAGSRCSDICAEINEHFSELDLLKYRSFGYGHSFGVLSHYYGREAGLELREDVDTVLEPGMVVSMEPMLTIPDSMPGAGGYREHDILVVRESETVNITRFPYGPNHNILG